MREKLTLGIVRRAASLFTAARGNTQISEKPFLPPRRTTTKSTPCSCLMSKALPCTTSEWRNFTEILAMRGDRWSLSRNASTSTVRKFRGYWNAISPNMHNRFTTSRSAVSASSVESFALIPAARRFSKAADIFFRYPGSVQRSRTFAARAFLIFAVLRVVISFNLNRSRSLHLPKHVVSSSIHS